ncbi:hypothetical protein IFM89_018127 [Coptis chinensis]|uniref:Alanyl-transfer RNA synthetases family profile domain-containing protein n=1 Tax=Coptis chinensis TaxID=261450 RepID=A0A835HU10_9MAGN|nr:hypothetical protein IFM89_018127 [Coptis chinensis]
MADSNKTQLEYFDNMWKLESQATLISYNQGEDGRRALILDSTIFHPQGGGQPYDTGYITNAVSDFKFLVQDVRLKDGLVFHYGEFKDCGGGECDWKIEKGLELCLFVDEQRRSLNSRLHSAGHLLDVCIRNVGLDNLEPGKAYHFPDGPFVEYKGTILQSELQKKQKELELDANALIAKGMKVYATILSYEDALESCGGQLPDYIPKGSSPRILRLGNNPGCPCGGTHVADISDIKSLKRTHGYILTPRVRIARLEELKEMLMQNRFDRLEEATSRLREAMVELLQPKPLIVGGASIAQCKTPVVIDDNKEKEGTSEVVVLCLARDYKCHQQQRSPLSHYGLVTNRSKEAHTQILLGRLLLNIN